ncbi:MAG TPA: hypothetical protein VEC93_15380, partial [Anaerolineae bacterium]|nr:hypothetical protein [Anaerolineae bacterium]
MRCPNCDHPTYYPPQPCLTCQFNGDPALIEELDHIEWILHEINTWWQTLGVKPYDLKLIQQKYITRQRELEIALGLRLPPFTPEEARNAWPELFQREALLQKIAAWLAAGLINPATTQKMVDQATQQVNDLLEQLEDHPRPIYPQTDTERLELINFLLKAADYLYQQHGFINSAAETQIRAPLLTEKEQLEIKLGFRPASEPAPQPISESAKRRSDEGATEMPAATISPAPGLSGPLRLLPGSSAPPSRPSAPSVPPPPFRDRLWSTLLSERTLQALLFLGIFLLFAAALSFVVWGWKDFSAPLRVAIPSGFTAVFFALGWYVRTKTLLYRSGIALSAIAALLIPIDFYTIYVNFHISPDYWPLFWLITSLASLIAYII